MPDLAPGTVHDAIFDTLSKANAATVKWAKPIATSAQQPTGPSFRPFTDSEPNPMQRVESMAEHAVGSDPSLLGLVGGLGNFLLTTMPLVGDPVTAITDQYQVDKIRDLQAKFLKDHGDTLLELDEDLSITKLHMRELGDLLDKTYFDPSKLDRIMKEKQRAGDHERAQIDDALKRTTDPEERKKLEAMKDDLDKWRGDRDQRLSREKPDVDLLKLQLEGYSDGISDQKYAIINAGNSASPSTSTGRRTPDSPNRVIDSSHTRPDAVMHVASLHNLLLQARGGLTGALGGGS